MSDSYNGTGVISLFDGHEDRIQRLEEDRVEVGAQVAKQTVVLEHMSEKIDTLSETVGKMGDSFAVVVSKLNEGLAKEHERVTKLETGEERSEKWKDLVRKILYASITAGLAGAGTLLAERLFGH